MQNHFLAPHPPNDWVVQEYLEGPTFSLEIVGVPGNYIALQITDLEMDARHDCKRVAAPTRLTPQQEAQFEKISLDIADARLPSQTPTTVYWSTGVNILQLLAGQFLDKKDAREDAQEESQHPVVSPEDFLELLKKAEQGVIYEHINVSADTIEVCGEHIMAGAGAFAVSPTQSAESRNPAKELSNSLANFPETKAVV